MCMCMCACTRLTMAPGVYHSLECSLKSLKFCMQVCYLRHAFGLGEHYNSVEPVVDEDEEAATDET
jgi:hypothetical protein